LHVKPQLVPLHVAVAFAGAEHGVHDVPQVLTLVSSTQAPEQSWKPLTHENPHAAGVPPHVGIALATVVVHCVLEAA
jgi:hypothetical protein